MTIGITGATGQLGQLAVGALKVKTDDLVALVRDVEKAKTLGIAARHADYQKPDTLAKAFEGIDVLVFISSSDFSQRLADHKAVIAAAKAANVGRIIYTSILRADTNPMILAADHKATEQAILNSGLPYTFLRNGWYLENWTGNLAAAIEAGAIIGAAGDGELAGATRQDFAEAIAAAATQAGHENQIYELTGDEPFTMSDYAALVSAKTGKQIPYVNMGQKEYADTLQKVGLPEAFAQILADSDARGGEGALLDKSKTLSGMIGRPTTSLEDAISASL